MIWLGFTPSLSMGTRLRAMGAAVLSFALATQAGCMHVETTSSVTSSRIVDERVEKEVHGEPLYDVVLDVRMASDTNAAISGQIGTYRQCEVHTTATRENTILHDRHPNSVAGVWAVGIAGALAGSVFAWGVNEHAHGAPLSRTEPGEDSEKLTNVGAAVYFGAPLSLLFVDAVLVAFRSIDSETTERVPENRPDHHDRCEQRPLPGASVAIKSQGLIAAQVESDPRGHFELALGADKVRKGAPALTLMVNHQDIDTPDSLHALELAFSRSATTPTVAPSASDASKPSPSKALVLHGVALKGAERSVLEAAIETSGGHRVRDTGSKNISQFDIALFTLPGMQRIKLMFDGQDRFVQAKYQGRISQDKHKEMLAALRERYGFTPDPPPGSPAYVSTFDDGLTLTYRLEDWRMGQAVFSLSYVDVTAEAALRDAVKKRESQR